MTESWLTRGEAIAKHGVDPERLDARRIRSMLVQGKGPLGWVRLYLEQDVATTKEGKGR